MEDPGDGEDVRFGREILVGGTREVFNFSPLKTFHNVGKKGKDRTYYFRVREKQCEVRTI